MPEEVRRNARDPICILLARLEGGEVETHYLPPRINGTVRLDMVSKGDIDQIFVSLQRGKVRVGKFGRKPGAVIRGPRRHFNRLAQGHVRFIPLWFRNDLSVEGDLRLADAFARLLMPGPPNAHHPRDLISRLDRKDDRQNA